MPVLTVSPRLKVSQSHFVAVKSCYILSAGSVLNIFIIHIAEIFVFAIVHPIYLSNQGNGILLTPSKC